VLRRVAFIASICTTPAGFAHVINNTGGSVDFWDVDADSLELVESPDGNLYHPGTIPPTRLRLI
jgi:hypothetical protein